ncbi:uncharacterized protein BP5553_05041 [Venustampulla echinocandica]|uniref:Uncharacterized protein n=1 Tax=Venustampulla echinocandica TaxID=2656787 RepID=A0A370TQ18_9HELO|nr:uncharacterized protein BP5553_05041 [Venustampulla echinocandica]RDL37608.1 hypothetical protein BP5553_05041 [Venustampulla echinocandica]
MKNDVMWQIGGQPTQGGGSQSRNPYSPVQQQQGQQEGGCWRCIPANAPGLPRIPPPYVKVPQRAKAHPETVMIGGCSDTLREAAEDHVCLPDCRTSGSVPWLLFSSTPCEATQGSSWRSGKTQTRVQARAQAQTETETQTQDSSP